MNAGFPDVNRFVIAERGRSAGNRIDRMVLWPLVS